jgi:NRPS condensation-like uncharacterized protein
MTSTSAAPDSIRLNLLDELFLGLDHGEEPWTVHLEARIGGRLDPARLTAAIQAAARSHPLMRARLADWRLTDLSYRWEIAERLDDVKLTVADCADAEQLAAARERLMATSPSLETAPPFAVLLAHGPAGDTLALNLHHAAVDGIGAVRVLRSILAAYAGQEDQGAPVDPLAVRDVRALAGSKSLGQRMLRARALARHRARGFGPPTRLARDGGDERAGYGFEMHALSVDETRALLDARPPGATVNDVLLAALAVTIRRWNDRHGRCSQRITLSMPVNLRPAEWRTEVVGNFASYVTVTLCGREAEALPRAVETVARQTRAIKRDGLAGIVIDLLLVPSMLTVAAKRRLPDLIPLTGNVVVDTAGLSNLGVIEPLPDVGVEDLWFSQPGRMPLGAAMGVLTFGGRLRLTLRYRHAQFDRAGAAAFAALYRDVLSNPEEDV